MLKLRNWRDVWQYRTALPWRSANMEGESDSDSKRKKAERGLKWAQIMLSNSVSPKQPNNRYYPSSSTLAAFLKV